MSFRLFLILSLFAIVYSPPALSQNPFGIRLGVNAATLTGSFASSSGAEQRTGFAAGIYGAMPLRYGLVAQAEMLYMQKGFRPTLLTLIGEDGSVQELSEMDASLELTYIEVPALIKYPVYVGSFRVDPYAGPFISFELAERLRIERGGDGTSEQNDDVDSPDLGVVIGGDLNLTVGTLNVVFGGRYTRGLKSLLEPRVEQQGRSDDVFTSTFSFFVGLDF